MRAFLLLLLPLLIACPPREGDGGDDDDSATSDDDDAAAGPAEVKISTTLGEFTVQVFEDESPITAANFLQYVDDGFFDGDDGEEATVFHRVIDDFVIQGGGRRADGSEKATRDAIVNEAIESGLSNTHYTLSMARTDAPDSATSQWFVNLDDNTFLDPGGSSVAGYAVFAEVIEGTDVVDAIGAVTVGPGDVPATDVVIEDAERQ